MKVKCILFGHNLMIGKSKSYKGKALICKRCGKQSSIWKQSKIEETLFFNNGRRFLPSGVKDNHRPQENLEAPTSKGDSLEYKQIEDLEK